MQGFDEVSKEQRFAWLKAHGADFVQPGRESLITQTVDAVVLYDS